MRGSMSNGYVMEKVPGRFRRVLDTLYQKRYAYLFISPFFILFSVFFLYPTIYAFTISLHQWKGFNTYAFVGINNYLYLLRDPHFLQAIYNSFYLMIASSIPQLILSVLIAVTLNSKVIRGRNFWRAAYFSPIILSPVVVGIVFSLIFDQHYGFLNYILSFIGISKLGWLNSQELSKIAVSTLESIALTCGLAGLGGIPPVRDGWITRPLFPIS